MKIAFGWTALLASISLFLPGQAAARERLFLEPDSAWEVEYATNSCAIKRAFRHGDRWAQIELRRFSPATAFTMSLSTNALRQSRAFQYRLGQQEPWHEPGAVDVRFTQTFMRASFPLEPASQSYDPGRRPLASGEGTAADVSEIAITNSAFGRELVMLTGPLEAPLAAMTTCFGDLLTHWGLDAEAQQTLQKSATPTNIQAVEALKAHASEGMADSEFAILNFLIDEKGAITRCSMELPLRPSGNARSCPDLGSSISFEPALDKEGRPIKSFWTIEININGPVPRARI